ncbi:induced during granule regeneration 1, putative, partial [Ichthyophthirius multifiliis]
PTKPTITEPTKPTITEPTKPTITEPTKPTITEPTKPTITEPTKPTVPTKTITVPTVPVEPTKPTITEPTKPTITEPTKPTITEPTKPTITEPTKPTITEPTKPTITEPTKPTITEPTKPTVPTKTITVPTVPVEPTKPTITEPTKPTITEPTKPTITEPTKPTITEPTKPTITEPTKPTITEPTKPTVPTKTITVPTVPVEPTKPTITEPTKPTTTEPTKPTITEPTKPTITEPTKPTVPTKTITVPTVPVEPTKPTITEPTKPTITEPTKPTITEPTKPTITEPTKPTITEPTKPTITEPTESPKTPTPSVHIQLCEDILKVKQFDYNSPEPQPVFRSWTNQFNNEQEFAIQLKFRLSKNIDRNDIATIYHLNSNQNPEDSSSFGDRVLALQIHGNKLIFSTYDINSENVVAISEVNFDSRRTEGKWIQVYHAFSPLLNKVYGLIDFGFKQSEFILENAIHQDSSVYHLFVGQSFNSRNFPGEIKNVSFYVGSGAYQESFKSSETCQKVTVPNTNVPTVPPTIPPTHPQTPVTIPTDPVVPVPEDPSIEIIKIEECISDTILIQETFFYQFEQSPLTKTLDIECDKISAYSVEGYFKVSSEVENKEWATGFHLTSTRKFEESDHEKPGDRVLAFMVIGNIMHFSTYDLNTSNTNYYHNIPFEDCDQDRWIYVYFGYSFQLQKAYLYTQIERKLPVIKVFENIKHDHNDFYQIFVGQSYNHKNFPGEIRQLIFKANSCAYIEQGFVFQVPQGKPNNVGLVQMSKGLSFKSKCSKQKKFLSL